VPPTLTFGAELGIDLAIALAEEMEGPELTVEPLVRTINGCVRLLTGADTHTASLSVPETRTTSPDVSQTPGCSRVRWLIRYALSRWRYDLVLPAGAAEPIRHIVREGRAMESHEPLGCRWPRPDSPCSARCSPSSFNATYLPTGAWAILGGVQALVFAGSVCTSAPRRTGSRRLPRRCARRSDEMAERFREDATRGRALGAVLQAEDMHPGMDPAMREVLIRHSRPARSRFGELVPERRAEQLPGRIDGRRRHSLRRPSATRGR
jgi:hypothetical protein